MRRAVTNVTLVLLLGLVANLILPAGQARAWWNDDWSLRKKLTIDTSAAGASISDPIGTTPILIRLHSGNFRFDSAKDDGSDIRFVAGDDKTPLKYHIEKYDGLLNEAFIWVSVPDVKPGAQTTLWLYYGNKKIAAGDDSKGTYDPDTVLVYHFAEHGGAPAHDSSTWANNATRAGLSADGSMIGSGQRLDGQTIVTLPDSPSLAWADGAAMTWSAWIKMDAAQPGAVLFSRYEGAASFAIGLDKGSPFVAISGPAGAQRSVAGASVSAGTWHHLAVTADKQITIYLDGNPYATLAATLPALTGAPVLGGDFAGATALVPGFKGELDELEISKVARPAGFIKAAAIGQGGDLAAKFLVFGDDEQTASWSSGYFSVILKSVTLDGWVVIGILMVMAVISWVVMAEKATYVGKLGKANSKFLYNFRHVAADLTILDRGDAEDVSSFGGQISAADRQMMRHSSLYRIYHIGAEEIRHRFLGYDEEEPRVLSAESIAAIKAGLDTGLVREMQRLNKLMVFLTIAISGGPFLGLLGTVVGVMITFAAIAASGDVNVNAIAPGIAAALVATVAGLGVAIPALFGYNYLISQIKDATSDMQVFVDEFVAKMAEFYAARPARSHSLAAE